jgi:hypothetical protein
VQGPASWFGFAMAICGALGCGGIAERDADLPPVGSNAGSSNGGWSGAGNGAGGLHSVLIPCGICTIPALDCTGPQYPESQSTFRTNVSANGCDYEPAIGFDGLEFGVDCKDGPTTVSCKTGYCGQIVASDAAISVENQDGSVAFTCSRPAGVR